MTMLHLAQTLVLFAKKVFVDFAVTAGAVAAVFFLQLSTCIGFFTAPVITGLFLTSFFAWFLRLAGSLLAAFSGFRLRLRGFRCGCRFHVFACLMKWAKVDVSLTVARTPAEVRSLGTISGTYKIGFEFLFECIWSIADNDLTVAAYVEVKFG